LLRQAYAAQTALIGSGAVESLVTLRELGSALALLGRHAEAERSLSAAYRGLEARDDYWAERERRETERQLKALEAH
jgi:hypothetical protein